MPLPNNVCYGILVGNNGGYHKPEAAPAVTQAVKMQPILVPTIPIEELSEVTDNFGNEALIGEGSYGRVYYGMLKNGQPAAIKKLDASKQPDDEFLAQVCIQIHPPITLEIEKKYKETSVIIYIYQG